MYDDIFIDILTKYEFNDRLLFIFMKYILSYNCIKTLEYIKKK